jgi:cytochrome c
MTDRAWMALAALMMGAADSAPEPDVGRRPSAAELASDGCIFPDGRGLPPGRGTVRDGGAVYRAQCAGCHGQRGEGSGTFPALAGGVGSLNRPGPLLTVGSYWPSATSLFEYTRRAMPYAAPGSLTNNEVYAVSAYVLFLNGILTESAWLDARSLPQVRMPNRDGFKRGSPPP